MGDSQHLSPEEQIAPRARAVRGRHRLHRRRRGGVRDPRPRDARADNRFEELQAAAAGTPLEPHLVGELIASEVEVRTGRCDDFEELAGADRRAARAALRAGRLARDRARRDRDAPLEPAGRTSGSSTRRTTAATTRSSGTSSGATTASACTCTSAIRGADRAIAVCNALRNFLPELLALSASSPFVEGVNTGLHSARTQIFTRMFPRCGMPDAYDGWDGFEATCASSTTRARSTSTRSSGGASGRISRSRPSRSGSATRSPTSPRRGRSPRSATRSTARIARALDEGEPLPTSPHRLIEENLWRAIRYGLSGELIDLATGDVRPARAAARASWSSGCCPVAEELGAAPYLADRRARTRPSGRSPATRRARRSRRSTPSRSARRGAGWLTSDEQRLVEELQAELAKLKVSDLLLQTLVHGLVHSATKARRGGEDPSRRASRSRR